MAAARPVHALSLWRRLLIALIRGFYFRRARALNFAPQGDRPRLLLCSHRNGAIDGYVVLSACPRAQFTLSAQLLRNPLLRLMFSGIPVVRAKDRQRYSMRRGDFPDPMDAICAHLRAGGALAFFPEGGSEWGHAPLPYQSGHARVVRRLLEEGVPLEVVPLGLFYRRPDAFRSEVEVLAGDSIDLPPRGAEETPRQWEKRLKRIMGTALDAVSVHCPDQETFARVERLAATQADTATDDASYVAYPFLVVFALLFAPVLLAGGYAGKKADGRNTITFFRMIGGLAAALLWLPVLLVLFGFYPLLFSVLWLMAWAGWRNFPEV